MSWHTWRLFTGARAVCSLRVLLVILSPLLPPPNFLLFFLLCVCFFWFFLFFVFFVKWKRGRVHTAGTGMGNWCSGAVVLSSPVCVVGALSAAAPQSCGSRVLMYIGADRGGFG